MTPGASSSPRIRPATAEDADALGAFHVASWREAYAGLLPAEFLAGLDVDGRARRWRDILEGGSAGTTLLAASAGGVVGLVSVGPSLQPAQPATAGLYALYVDAAEWGTGLGYRLHEAGLGLLRTAGAVRAELWVLRTNARAISFYERQGWYADGRTQLDDHLPGVQLDEIGMSLDLA